MKTEDLDNLTLSQLLFSISELDNSQEKPRYSGKMLNLFPQFTVKFKSKAWNWETARSQLQIYMTIEGFGPNGNKRYHNPEDKPSYWPSGVSLSRFPYP